ncbi:MAG: GNAT family N-acetyltransferase [Bacteroidales bacterium]|nr:GNAT family N-acetyltransferase [Bacteroidales bacterium]MBR6540111.1 GNAT family N-acetyltransferase [Bacteroidales bacterium]
MWCKADYTDVSELVEMFWENISSAPEYISHGEIQMGMAKGPGELEDEDVAKEVWTDYIMDKIERQDVEFNPEDFDPDNLPAAVLIYTSEEDDKILAFSVLELSEDGASAFGVICDMLVHPSKRGTGLGSQLLEKSKEWFRSLGIDEIYLESGLNNHSAHQFFEKKGFKPVSYVFKLS